ncbi:MAG: hypothetical protein HKN88_00385 [Gammaproteobacteria bacterium]|nr:TorF family putative porin [Gammaproteobacteria bacterium]NNC96507.1 hypothetical protein [Gammaproteobacteria bacterium]NNM14709.1 hypothetical protein [Gammaproteobacteria bacterium]
MNIAPKVPKLVLLTTLASSMLISATTLVADDDPISANVAISTDYVWRGVSQTLENPAISGGFDFAPTDNWYVGVWGSNVDFGDVENMEFDIYAGWTTELDNGLGIDIGFIQYLYFDSAGDVDFNEFYAGLSHSGFSGTISYDGDSKWTYYDLGYEYELANGVGLAAHIGNYDLDSAGDYTDYSLGVSASLAGLDYALTYHDTDIDNLAEGDGRVVLTIGKSF